MLRRQSIFANRRALTGALVAVTAIAIGTASSHTSTAQSRSANSTLSPRIGVFDRYYDVEAAGSLQFQRPNRGQLAPSVAEPASPNKRGGWRATGAASIGSGRAFNAKTPGRQSLLLKRPQSDEAALPRSKSSGENTTTDASTRARTTKSATNGEPTLLQPGSRWRAAGDGGPNSAAGDQALQWRPRSPANASQPAEPTPISETDSWRTAQAAETIGGKTRPQLEPRDEGETDSHSDALQAPVQPDGPSLLSAAPEIPNDSTDSELSFEVETPVLDGPALGNPSDEPSEAAETVVIDDRDDASTDEITPTPTAPSREAQERSFTPPAVQVRNLPPLTRQQTALRDKIRRVLQFYYNRPLHTGNRGPWEVMHAMLSFEVHSRVLQGGPNGDPITAVGWLCFNQPCRKRNLLYLNKDGDLRARVGPALQGHQGQLLALLALSRVKADYPIRVDDKQLTIRDLIEMEKQTCYPKTELTFKLIGLQNYLDPKAAWVNDQGMTWNFERLVAEELRQPIRGAACGGVHRLTGLALGVKARKKAGLPVTGTFARAERFVGQHRNYAYRLQNRDGSFSTEWFRGPGDESDIDRRLKTTGHTLEWLLYSGDQQHLSHNRTVRAVNYLTNLMWSNRNRDWEAGPLGHAIHSLVLYDRLVFSKYDQGSEHPIAGKATPERR